MNILLITQLYPQPDDEGDNKPTKTVQYFADVWQNQGHNVAIAHCPSKFPFVFYLIPPKIKNYLAGKTSNIFPNISSRKNTRRVEDNKLILRLPLLKSLPGKGYSHKYLRKISDQIIKNLGKENFVPDIVMGHFANPSTELVSLISQKYNCKSSIVFHGDCNEVNLSKYRIVENLQNIKAIGARSQYESKKIQKLLSLKELPFICYSGVPDQAVKEIDRIETHNLDDTQGLTYLYVGSLIKRKNLISVIEAFDQQAEMHDKLLIIGGGPEEEKIKNFISQLKNVDKIHMLGRIPREEVMEHMSRADVFALISSNEVFGMVYIEAMLNGCITIASAKGGVDGIIIDNQNGYLCEQGNTKMLSSIFAKIKDMTPNEFELMRNKAQETAKHFSETEVATNYLNKVLARNEE